MKSIDIFNPNNEPNLDNIRVQAISASVEIIKVLKDL